ncbi:hypothetical protein E3N88_10347 [Mikania micrantha]|uniref:Uncharacterized protein n=1 Tax=Mikania micrantha TaxID=192012 RepID=A0A5N6PD78_9ASTR|nr:hypothetical protein E3N88_10347 [Mikania micrantha]
MAGGSEGSWHQEQGEMVRHSDRPSEGRSYSSEATLFPKDNSLLLKAVQDNCFGRSTLRRFKASELPILEAAEEQKLPKTLLSIFLDNTSEINSLIKTVADYPLWYKRC